MNADPAQPTGPDLTAGVDVGQLADGAVLLGHVGSDAVLLARSGAEVFAIGATCSHYGGPLVDGLAGRRYGALPLASCLLQLADRRGHARPGTEPRGLLDGGTHRRQIRRACPTRDAVAAGIAGCRRYAGIDRHHWRRSRGAGGIGDPAAGGLRRAHHGPERGCHVAVRSAEPLEGLSRRHRVRGLDAAAGARLLPAE